MFTRKKVKQVPTTPQEYPVGSAVSTGNAWYYIKDEKTRMRIPSNRVLESWSFHRVIETSEAALRSYKIMGKLGFRSGSLLYNIASGKMYLVSQNKLRHITSPEALERIGAGRDDAVTVSDADINLHGEGAPLT